MKPSPPLFAPPWCVAPLCAALALSCTKPRAEAPTKSPSPVAEAAAPEVTDEATPEKRAEAPPQVRAKESDSGVYPMDGFELRFAPSRATLTQGATKEHVLFDEELAERDCLQRAKDPEEAGQFDYIGAVKLLFVTEEMLGYELNEGGYCGGAHPFAHTGWRVVRPSRPEERVKLDELVEREAIARALQRDALVQRVRDDSDGELCLQEPRAEELTEFAFRGVEGELAEVAVLLNYSAEVCRGAVAVVELMLPLKSEALLEELTAAQERGQLLEQLHPGYDISTVE